MRVFVIATILFLAAIACAAETTNEETDFTPDAFDEESSPVTALAEAEADIQSKASARTGFWRRRRRRRRTVNYERRGKERDHKALERSSKSHQRERTAKERTSKERTSKERASKTRERASKERTSKERASKERASKERTSKERTSKERTTKERSTKERSTKERASKETSSKERTSKERTTKERASKETSSKERASKAAERSRKERSTKEAERNNKEKEVKASQPKTQQWAYKREAWNGQKGCQWAATTEDCSAAAAKISSIKQPNRILDQNRGFESTGVCFVNSITHRVFFRPACALGPRSDCKSPHASHIMVPKGHGLELICRSRKDASSEKATKASNARERFSKSEARKAKKKEDVHWVPGWCHDWVHGDLGMVHGDPSQQQCEDACKANSRCHQAVWEAQGPWRTECWLGTSKMDRWNGKGGTSRNCDRAAQERGTVRCVDHCFSKKGWWWRTIHG